MNPFENPEANGFPNSDCRATRIAENGKLAWCIAKNSNQCPHVLFFEKKRLCSHAECEAIVKWTEEIEE